MTSRLAISGCLLTVLMALGAAHVAGDEPRVLQGIRYDNAPAWVDVSPTGHVIALANRECVRAFGLEEDGRIGDARARVELPLVRVCKFSPSGRRIVCDTQSTPIYIVDRSDWSYETLYSPDLAGPLAWDIATISQRPEAYLSYLDSGYTVVVDFRQRRVLRTVPPYTDDDVSGLGVVMSPDGARLCQMLGNLTNEDQACVQGWTNSVDGCTFLWKQQIGWPAAGCPGPDPQHILVVSQPEAKLYIINVYTGAVAGTLDLDLELPRTIDMTPDGWYVVVGCYNTGDLQIISALDLRGLIAGDTQPADVRSAKLRLNARPDGLCAHPELHVCYAWSERDSRLNVVRLAIPGL